MTQTPYQIDILCYFGSFDPPHNGHAAVVRHALSLVKPRQLHLMVAAANLDGKDLSPIDDRVRMLKIFSRQFGSQVRVNTIERDEQLSGATIDTINAMAARYPHRRLGVLLGSDNLQAFFSWQGSEGILRRARCFFVKRGEFIGSAAPEVGTVELLPELSARGQRYQSSLEVKRRLLVAESPARGRSDIAMLPELISYVHERRLYQGFFERHPELR